MQAEMLVLKEGLHIANEQGYMPLEVETDLTDIINCLDQDNTILNTVIRECRLLML